MTDAVDGRPLSTNNQHITSTHKRPALSPVTATMYTSLREHGYQLGATIGRGSFSKVKRAYSTKHDHHVALKLIDKRQKNRTYVHKFLPRELKIVLKLHHLNIISVYQIFQSSKMVCISEELAIGGDLLQRIHIKGTLSEPVAAAVFAQITQALVYLHDQQIAHRDLKCENVFLDTAEPLPTVKLGDLGFARVMAEEDLSATYCGSKAYAAPEIIRGLPYKGTAMDVWSLGIALYVMLTSKLPFDDSNPKTQLKEQMARRLQYPTGVTGELTKVLYTCLDPNQASRPTANQVAGWRWVCTGLREQQRQKAVIQKSLVSIGTPRHNTTKDSK